MTQSTGHVEQEAELDGEVGRLIGMLNDTEVKAMDWAETIACAPRAVGIIGECLLLSSHRRATLVQLSDDRLRASSLPVNLRQCARTGTTAFEEAASRMRNISAQAVIASKDGSGVIDRITKFACKTQTQAVAKELERQKANLKRVASNCTKDAEELQLSFKNWNEETKVLLEALDVSNVTNGQKADKTADALLQTEHIVERLKTELGFRGMNLEEIEKRLLERKIDSVGTELAGAPIITAGMLLALFGASAGAPLVFGAAFAIWGRKAFTAYTQMNRDTQVQELQTRALEAQRLDQQLKKLNSDSCTMEEIRGVLSTAIRQLLDLQYQVSTLLNFFQAVFKQVESMDQHGARELIDRIDDQGFKEDEDIKQLLLEDTLSLKTQFTFIGRLANMYSEISLRYLLPGMNRVQMLGLSDDSRTPAQIEAKKEELEHFKVESQEGVRQLTVDKQEQLNNDMERLIREGVLSLKSIAA